MESSPISAEAVQILNFVFEEGRRRQNNDVEGKVLRQALAVKTEAITALVPTHLTAFGTPRVDDSYQLTFEGLLASSYVEALKESLKALLRVFIGKYRADPRFPLYSFNEVQKEADREIDASFFQHAMRIAEVIIGRTYTEGNPVVMSWEPPKDLELILEGAAESIPRLIGVLRDRIATRTAPSRLKKAMQSAAAPGPVRGALSAVVAEDLSEPGDIANTLPLFDKIQAALATQVGEGVAACYHQAVRDLQDQSRVSFVGTAAELRLALTETLRVLAPDAEVRAVAGFKPATQTGEPSWVQRADFILAKRHKTLPPAKAQILPRIEAGIAELAKHLTDRSSKGVHTVGAISEEELAKLLILATSALADLLL